MQNIKSSLLLLVLIILSLSACTSQAIGATSGNQVSTSSPTEILPTEASSPTVGTTTVPAVPTPTIAAVTPTQTASSSLEQVDWNNFTYTFGCFTAKPIAVTMHNGEASQNGIRYSVHQAVFGDLNGDGQSEAVIIYHCEGGGTSPSLVYVYSGTAQHPFVLANLPDSNDALNTVFNALVLNGVLQLSGRGYTKTDALCCPSLVVTSTYKWSGTSFQIVDSKSVPLSSTPTN